MRPSKRRSQTVLRAGGTCTPIGRREAAIARLLQRHPDGLTRLEMLKAAPPGMALGAPGYVSRLRKAGAPIESVPTTGTDAGGTRVRFVRYRLAGEIKVTREAFPHNAEGGA